MIENINQISSFPIFQIFIGAGITWLAAWYYYRRAGSELRDEAKDLRKLSNMILRFLEISSENIKCTLDDEGNPKAINIRLGLESGSYSIDGLQAGLTHKAVEPVEKTD